MLTVETIRKIRLAVHRDGKSIRKTAKDLCLSRNTVRKVIRSDQTAFEYKRRVQPHPRLGDHINLLEERLSTDQNLPKKQRRTAQMLYEGLQLEGYEGGYRYRRWAVKALDHWCSLARSINHRSLNAFVKMLERYRWRKPGSQ